MTGSERGSMDDIRGQIFTELGIYEVNRGFATRGEIKTIILTFFVPNVATHRESHR